MAELLLNGVVVITPSGVAHRVVTINFHGTILWRLACRRSSAVAREDVVPGEPTCSRCTR